MFNSPILDVALGLVLAFLGVSLAASAITEIVNSLLGLRAKTLLSGIKDLFNDQSFTGLAKDLYSHALINPLASGEKARAGELTRKPAYIESRQFALALIDIIHRGALAPDAAGNPANPAEITAAIEGITDPQIKATLKTLWTAAGNDAARFQTAIASWFDNVMDRVAGDFKRYAQLIGFIAAFVVAGVFNIDAVHITTVLWQKPSITAQLDVAKITSAPPAGAAGNEATDVIDLLEGSTLVGWTSDTLEQDGWSWFAMIAGWLAVAGASLLGAPFWFDILKTVIQIRGTGLTPAERKAKQSTKHANV